MEKAGMEADRPGSSVHPAVAPLAYLLGTWRGQGQGCYPTIRSFSYTEELQFTHSNPHKPVIAYAQKTWRSPGGPGAEPMHSESGFWRLKPDGSVEVVIAQSTGLVEVQVSISLGSRSRLSWLYLIVAWLLLLVRSSYYCWATYLFIDGLWPPNQIWISRKIFVVEVCIFFSFFFLICEFSIFKCRKALMMRKTKL